MEESPSVLRQLRMSLWLAYSPHGSRFSPAVLAAKERFAECLSFSEEQCDVAVLGGGITGAFAAEALTAAGLDVVVLDKRDVGTGSTSASTALLQYKLDTSRVRIPSLAWLIFRDLC